MFHQRRPVCALFFALALSALNATGCGETEAKSDGAARDAASNAAIVPGAANGVCELPQVVGPCEAAIPRFWYNAASRECEPFTYGGCKGNANNFESSAECQAKCSPSDAAPPTDATANVCTQPQLVGPCKAAIQRYWHNSATGKCELFTYGGCQGNANNFDSLTACQTKCPGA